MKSQSSYVVTNSGIAVLKIEYSKSNCANVSLSSAWNIVSMPLNASSMATTVLFPAATSLAYGYSAGYSQTDTLVSGKGYWIRYPQAATINVCGSSVSSTQVSLNSGWNIIGPYGRNALVSALTTTPAGLLTSLFYGYNAGYSIADTLQPGKGYWIRANSNCILNLPVGLAKSDNPIVSKYDKNWNKLTIADAAGSASTLYLADNAAAISNYELPPLPPAGIFDARFASQRNVELLNAGAQKFVLNGAVYPVSIRIDGMDTRIKDAATNGKIVNQLLKNGQTFVIDNSSLAEFTVENASVPTSFELFQNYPNPFNPSTNIKFSIATKSNVELSVYNSLGEKVAMLVNGEKEVGVHEVEWNASNMSSGVYFYEIRAGQFLSVKKLLLMK